MTSALAKIIQTQRAQKYATDAGVRMHNKLQFASPSDTNLWQQIQSCPGLEKYFVSTARTEVPIAGYINGRFVSRRIDRMVIDTKSKKIYILDYKTDTNRTDNRTKYIYQLREYRDLVRMIYPDFDIETTILWTHDWTLEKI